MVVGDHHFATHFCGNSEDTLAGHGAVDVPADEALGHIDWGIAAAFAVGSIPGAAIGSRLAQHLPAKAMKGAFGVLLIGFAIYFVVRQITQP